MLTQIEQDILRTVAWFSMSHYSMTSFEIWKWMLEPQEIYSLGDVVSVLEKSKSLSQALVEHDGSFTLKKHVAEPHTQHDCFVDAVRKMERLKHVMKYLRLIPTIRGVAVCNNLSWMNTSSESDIDLFIIVKDGSIWTTRLLAVAPFKILKLRPGNKTKHPLCFSFFISDANLSLESLQCMSGDPYLAYWTQSLVPVFDRGDVFKDFKNANAWTQDIIDFSYPNECHADRCVVAARSSVKVSGIIERVARRLQRGRFPHVITQMANRDSRVVVSDAMLKFHANDRREYFKEQHKILCNELGI